MAQKYLSPRYTQALTQWGLTPAQASMYEALVQYGNMTATRASFFGGISRTLGYKILSELESMGLVIKNEKPKSVATFSAAHPLKLRELAEKRFEDAQNAKKALDSAIFALISDFNEVAGQNGQILEGVPALKGLLDARLKESEPAAINVTENTPKKFSFSIVFKEK